MKYLTKIYWSDEDDAYIATVPALPGCIAHGATLEEAAANIRDCTELWLASAMQHKDPVPEPDLAAEEITRLAPILNVAALARLAGINPNTLASKLRRKSRFTKEETERLLAALERV
jgi:predicted RNase H-like HicB family nuclease